MSTAPYYVILTGSKNNAGDFLIRKRAHELFAALRPDRKIVEYDGWKPLTEEQLDVVNNSKALVLAGGPALQYNMYPGIYALVPDLTQIKVPVIMMGVGYKDQQGDWMNTRNYQLSESSQRLLGLIGKSGYMSGVRDYQTLNVLMNYNMQNAVMTGCPALYDLQYIKVRPVYPEKPRKIAFSLGVSYIESPGMNKLMRDNILRLKQHFDQSALTVYFHHSINKKIPAQSAMIEWLTASGIAFADISRSADGLVDAYSQCDLHVGYRVHAHIFCCSISRVSVLLNEDGRGKGLNTVIGGMIFNAYIPLRYTFMERVLKKLKLLKDTFQPYDRLSDDLIAHIEYEFRNGHPRSRIARGAIDLYYDEMKDFILALP